MLKTKITGAFSASVFTLATTLLSISFLTKSITTLEFADVAFILVIYALYSLFDVYRVPTLNLFFKRPKLYSKITSSLFYLVFTTSLLITVLSLLILLICGFGVERSLAISFSAFLFVSGSYFWIILDSNNLVVATAWCRAIAQSSLYLSLVILSLLQMEYYWALLIASSTLLLSFYIVIKYKQILFSKQKLDKKHTLIMKFIFFDSLSVFYHYLSSTLLANFERALCYLLGGPIVFAIATAFTEFSNKITFFSRIFNVAAYPTLKIWSTSNNHSKSRKFLFCIDFVYLFLFITTFLVTFLFAELIINILFSEEYLDYMALFVICIFSGTIRIFTYQAIIRLNLEGDFLTQSKYSSISALLAIFSLTYIYFFLEMGFQFEIFLIAILIIKIPDVLMFVRSLKVFNNATCK